MKKQNKWTIPLIVAIVCAVAVFSMHPGKAAAAVQEDILDPMNIDYLNPFDLTVQRITVLQSVSTSSTPVLVQPSAVTTTSSTTVSSFPSAPSSPYAQPLKVWIPFRPVFRSPCTPSW